MFLPPVNPADLRLAGASQVVFRWHTPRLRLFPELAALTPAAAQAFAVPAGIRILEHSADAQNGLRLVSLSPSGPVSVCAGKLKGALSKWLRGRLGLAAAENLLGRGYFASTA